MAHELIYSLAGGGPSPGRGGRRADALPARPAPAARYRQPRRSRRRAENAPRAAVVRAEGDTHARLDDASEAGIYRLALPDPPGGFAYAAIAGDAHESDMTPLDPAEAEHLAQGWPLEFAEGPERLGTAPRRPRRRPASARSGASWSWRPWPSSASRSSSPGGSSAARGSQAKDREIAIRSTKEAMEPRHTGHLTGCPDAGTTHRGRAGSGHSASGRGWSHRPAGNRWRIAGRRLGDR